MKLLSWNVNGIRSVLKKGLLDWLAASGADAVCLQEVRARPEDVDVAWPGYQAHWNPAEKAGYSGVMTLTRRTPLSVTRGIGVKVHDHEGRVLTTEHPDFFLVNVYVPNSQRELGRLPYRMTWDRAFLRYLRRLEAVKPVVFCGDLNVAHREIDLARPKTNVGAHGFTLEERAGFDRILKAGFVDAFRLLEPGGGHYTWWLQTPGVRERNVGWRIDYFLVSRALRPWIRAATIHPEVRGADHCPIGLVLRRPA
jgi:exodeoxyribonuclease-3